ncbi:MAG: DEAD/DEAH box helicase [Chitinophagales bacterium]
MNFEDFKLNHALLKALADEAYKTPTPIQEQSIPIVMKGKDLLGCAQTGTGKTAAFAVPILHLLAKNESKAGSKNIRALIVTPTRELAIQIDESFTAYGKYTGLRNTVVFGGVKQGQQTQKLRKGVDILIATPGRLLDLQQQGFINLRNLEIFVLDEADRMLDMGFIHDVKKIIKLLPQKRQTLLFSATMPNDIVKLAQSLLINPERVDITPAVSTADTVKQYVYFVDQKDKKAHLLYLLEKEEIGSVLVFTRTKYGADKLVKTLLKNNIKAEAIHGNKSQNARQRALSNFKDGKTRVLVATDIAARGIDVDGLSHVINFEIPNISETYVHRIGRTGRAGLNGKAISICSADEMEDWINIEKLVGHQIPELKNQSYPVSNPDEYDRTKVRPSKGKSKTSNQGRSKKPNWGKRRNARQSR